MMYIFAYTQLDACPMFSATIDINRYSALAT